MLYTARLKVWDLKSKNIAAYECIRDIFRNHDARK